MKIITDIKILKTPCEPITKETNLHKLNNKINQAIKFIIQNKSWGIAANQVGINKQFFIAVIDNNSIELFINPKIISHSDETNEDIEGCLSFPKMRGIVSRWNAITVKYFNGKEIKVTEFTGWNARIIQHEFDHLQGICYIEKAKNIELLANRKFMRSVIYEPV